MSPDLNEAAPPDAGGHQGVNTVPDDLLIVPHDSDSPDHPPLHVDVPKGSDETSSGWVPVTILVVVVLSIALIALSLWTAF